MRWGLNEVSKSCVRSSVALSGLNQLSHHHQEQQLPHMIEVPNVQNLFLIYPLDKHDKIGYPASRDAYTIGIKEQPMPEQPSKMVRGLRRYS
mgnify:CR=1 FL=1